MPEQRPASQAHTVIDGEGLYRTMFEEAGAAISQAALDGTWLRVNRRMCEMLGYAPDELVGLRFYDLTHPDDIAGDHAAVDQLVSGEASATRREKRYRRKDGSYLWVNITAALIRSPTGQPHSFVTVFEDISERKRLFAENEARRRAAEQVAEAGTLLASSLDHERIVTTLVALCVRDLADWCLIDLVEDDGSIRRAATGHADPAKAGLVAELARFPPGVGSESRIVDVLRSGQPLLVPAAPAGFADAVAVNAEHARILGALDIRSYMITPLVARGQVIGAMSFVRSSDRPYGTDELALVDELAHRAALAIDNARLYRQSEQTSRVKDEFLAMLSHELRTPLTAMLGWIRLLRDGSLDAAGARHALEVIERNTELQTQLIEDLLDVSRIVTGKFHLTLGPVNLPSVVQAALDAVRESADKKGIRLSVLGGPVAPIWGDPHRLQQVVVNLLSNAVKFTPPGGRVEIDVRRVDAHTQITVRDTGKGISGELLPRIFDRFRQADSTSTRKFGGLGLGLAIVRHLVDMHHGSVVAESAGEGLGATFTVRLPIMAVRLPAADGEPALTGRGGGALPSLVGVRAMVVDDDHDARELVKVVLEQRGASVTTAGCTRDALAAIDPQPPDVLISDISLPGEDGYALIAAVRTLRPEQGGLMPAIALTAYARAEDRLKALAAGFQLHVSKPVEPERLARAVAGVLGLGDRCP